MDSSQIKAILFDLGNVLIDFDHRIATERISKFTDKSPDEIFNLFFDSELTGLFIWNEIFFLSKKNLTVYNLAKQLRDRYKLALVSNINILHFDYIKKNFSVFDTFNNIITSYEVGFRKPHPLIYRKALEILRIPPPQVFYTDDRPELAQSAQELGIRGFVFIGIEQLKKDLIDSGIHIN
jgi:HAD superfamily hydrolase (TIGR01549 family)